MRQYRLTNLDPVYSPSKICVFDIETIQTDKPEPYACGFYDGEEFKLFEGRDCIEKFLRFFIKRKWEGWICYAHNGGRFDFAFIFDAFNRILDFSYYMLTPIRTNSSIIELKINSFKNVHGKRKKHRRWVLRDSVALIKGSLKEITKSFKVEHVKGDFDHEKINWNNWLDLKDEWLPYLESDCKGLYESLVKDEDFYLKNLNVNFQKSGTVASLAMRVFRTKFLDIEIPTYRYLENIIRKSYYGGRSEIFKLKTENSYYYDVNSLYPYVMKNNLFPIGSPVKTNRFMPEKLGIYYCKVYNGKFNKTPLLPYRHNNKLMFACGRFEGWYCSPEIKKAMELGYHIDIIEGFTFSSHDLFSKYVDFFYNIKQTSEPDSVAYKNAKLMLNSLYGKFGQKREQQMFIYAPDSCVGLEPYDTEGVTNIWKKVKLSESNFILPAISAFVTCYARLLLYKYLEKHDVVYCDTDSIITKDKISTSSRLGDMKIEYKIDKGIFLLPKMYGFCGLDVKKEEYVEKIRCKGFRRKFIKEKLTYGDYEYALINDDYSKFYDEARKMATIFESLRRNKEFVSMVNIKKSIKSRYDKRIVKGLETEPLRLNL